MQEERDELAAVTLNGHLYVTGGMGRSGDSKKSAERYDPTSDTWQSVAPMPEVRYSHAAAVLAGHLYVIGGYGLGAGALFGGRGAGALA